MAENLHCALAYWQALSRFARADEGGCMLRRRVWLPNRSLVTPIINWKCYRILRLLLESRTGHHAAVRNFGKVSELGLL
ncbi:MAG: hypothetical protein DMF33_11310 [Verrucomicrobia bacterium]|nr:MAG: hypothetical protein DMF33_11310 [Verrucomicrobiota bacterium]